MTEENKDNPEKRPSFIKESYLIIGAFVLMLAAIFTIWQVLLKGRMDEEISKQKDTIVQVKTDTVRIKDSLKNNPTQTERSTINSTEQVKDTSKLKSKLDELSKEDKIKLKEKFEELPKSKQERIKKKLRTSLNK
jgi:regulatory protein YycI of two-component signal transduction system YycFG